MSTSSQRALARVFAARGFAWQDEADLPAASEGTPLLDDEGQEVSHIERPREAQRTEYSMLESIEPLDADQRARVLQQLEQAENTLIHTLLTTVDEEHERWLMEEDERIDSNKSTTLEEADLTGLTRRERAEISMRVARAVLAQDVDFGPKVRAQIEEMLSLRRQIFADSLRLVVAFVLKRGQRLEPTTAILRGALGLDKAIDRFESERGNVFSTYANWWVRHSVTRSEMDFAAGLRIPVHAAEEASRFWYTQQKLWAQRGVRPSPREVLEQAGNKYSLQRLGAYRRRAAPATLGSADQLGPAEHILDCDVPSPIEGGLPSDWVAGALAKVRALVLRYEENARSDRHSVDIFAQRVLPRRTEMRTLRELGQEFDISRERVRQLEAQLLAYLRRRLFGLEEHLEPWRWSSIDE